MEQIPIRHKGHTLAPGPVCGGKVGGDIVILPHNTANAIQQRFLYLFRISKGHFREFGLLKQNLAAGDLVDPIFRNAQAPQFFGNFNGVAANAEISGRTLQHRNMLGLRRHGRDDCGGACT